MAVFKNLVNSFNPATDKKEELELALNLLYELALSKNLLFESEIRDSLKTAGSEDNYTIPISAILSSKSGVRAYKSSDSTKVIQEATNGVKTIIKGGGNNITEGIGSILGTAMNAILGSGAGEQHQVADYFVAIDKVALIRLDVKIWVRKIQVTGFQEEFESVIAYTAVKSSVDVNAIQFADFLNAYSYQLENTKMTSEDIIKELEQAKKIYDLIVDRRIIPQIEPSDSISSVTNVSPLKGLQNISNPKNMQYPVSLQNRISDITQPYSMMKMPGTNLLSPE